MSLSLVSAGEEYDIVQASFDICLDNMTESDFGNLLFDNLMKYGPNVHPKGSPKQIMSLKLFEMVTTLVSFSGDEELAKEQIAWLGLRHVSYGVNPEAADIMKEVLIDSIRKGVGEEYTEEMEKAWEASPCQRPLVVFTIAILCIHYIYIYI